MTSTQDERSLLQAFVASLTNGGNNAANCLRIDHDELRSLIGKAASLPAPDTAEGRKATDADAARAIAIGRAMDAEDGGYPEPQAPATGGPMTKVVAMELFSAIAHGDQEHRDWLYEALRNFADGKPVPAPRGKGTATLTGGAEGEGV